MDGDVVRIERLNRLKRGRPGEEIEVLLSDASSFLLSLRVWEESPFHEGDELTRDHLAHIQSASVRIAVREQALSLLARAEHSRFMLSTKLIARGRDPSVTGVVLDALEDEGLLSDERFARSWVRHRIRRHPEERGALAPDYHDPIVDHSKRREMAIEMFERARED